MQRPAAALILAARERAGPGGRVSLLDAVRVKARPG